MKRATSLGGPEPTSACTPRPDTWCRLRRSDLPLETEAFARRLIGTILVRSLGGVVLSGRIVETEAYTPDDPSSHAYRGRTARNGAMFARNLHAYVYFIYGTAFCLNISSEAEGTGAAALIRAVEPLTGLERMRRERGSGIRDRDLARGPGRLCRAFGIDRGLDGIDLDRDARLWLADDGAPPPDVGVSIRVGLTKAVEMPRRFYARENPYVSGPRRLSP